MWHHASSSTEALVGFASTPDEVEAEIEKLMSLVAQTLETR